MPIVQVPSSYGFPPVVGGMAPSMLTSLPVSVRGRVSPVRRRLFADGDAPELENRRLIERQFAQMQLEQSQQWNFDFKNGVPLNGRYEWVPTHPERPSHPLPPPAGIKRPIDNPMDAAPLRKQLKNDSHFICDSINNNNNNRPIGQTKITGNFEFSSVVSKFRKKNSRMCVRASVRRGWRTRWLASLCWGRREKQQVTGVMSSLFLFLTRGGK